MAPKHTVHAILVQPTKQRAKPRGLQLSAAQWKAYNKAYNATVKSGFSALNASSRSAAQTAALAQRRAFFNMSVQNLMKSRLNAAYRISKKAQAAHAKARTAAIAAFAVKMSYRQSVQAHQSAALQARILSDYRRHVRVAARLQYIRKGEAVYAHTAVMRTLTTSQATAIEKARFAAAAKAARKASASVKPVKKPSSAAAKAARSAAVAAILARARQAGMAAAAEVPPPKKRGRPRGSKNKVHKIHHHRAHRKRGKRSTTRSSRTRSRGTLGTKLGGAAPPVSRAKRAPRTAPRPADVKPGLLVPRAYGNPAGHDCVAAALANHLMYATGYRVGRRDYCVLVKALGEAPSIEGALEQVMLRPPWGTGGPVLAAYVPVVYYPPRYPRKLVVGVCSPAGAHAAVALETGSAVSWGELLPLTEMCVPGTGVEEAWDLLWILPRTRVLACRLAP